MKTEIVLSNLYGIGYIKNQINTTLTIKFNCGLEKNIQADNAAIHYFPRAFVDTILNRNVKTNPINYSIKMHNSLPNILCFKYSNKTYNYNMETFSFINAISSDLETILLDSLSNDMKKATYISKFQLIDLDLSMQLNTLAEYCERFLSIRKLNTIIDIFARIDDPDFYYTLVTKTSNVYIITLIFALTAINARDTYNSFIMFQPFTKTKNEYLMNFNRNIINKYYDINTFGAYYYFYYQNKDFATCLCLLFDEYNYFTITLNVEILKDLFTKITDFNVIINFLRNDDYHLTKDFFAYLVDKFPYEDNKDNYLKLDLKGVSYRLFYQFFPFSFTSKYLDHRPETIKFVLKTYNEFYNDSPKELLGYLYDALHKTYINYYNLSNINNLVFISCLKAYRFNYQYIFEEYNYDTFDFNEFLVLTEPLDEFMDVKYEEISYSFDEQYSYLIAGIKLYVGNTMIAKLGISKIDNLLVIYNCVPTFLADEELITYIYNRAKKEIVNIDELIINADNKIIETKQKQIIDKLNLAIESFNKETIANINLSLNADNLVVFNVSVLSNDINYSLGLSIGRKNSKMYIVKNLFELMYNFKNKVVHEYGKKLSFQHLLSNLDKPYDKLISYLSHIVTYPSRQVSLTADDLAQILEILLNNYICYNNISYFISSLEFVPEIYLDEHYSLKITNCGSDAEFLILNDKIVLLNKKLKTIQFVKNDNNFTLYKFVIENHDLDFSLVKDKFIYNVYARYSKLIKIDEQLKANIVIPEINIKAYFDYENEHIVVNTIYELDGNTSLADIRKYDYSHIIDNYENYIAKLGFKNNVISDSNLIVNFLMLDFTYLKSIADVYLSDSLQNKTVSYAKLPSIRMNYNSGILDCFLEDSLYSDEELLNIIKAMRSHKKYVLLKNNHILAFKDEDLHFSEVVDNLGLVLNDKFEHRQVPLYECFKNLGLYNNINIDDFVNNMLNDITNFKYLNIDLPKLNGELRSYQIEGYKWLQVLNKYHLGGILADDMGLGKTLEVISILVSLAMEAPILIVCPKSLIFNWLNEITKFTSTLVAYPIYGSQKERLETIKRIELAKKIVYVTSYESLLRDIDYYNEMKFAYVILDEAQAIKNMQALKAKAVKEIKAFNRLALTGTPIENQLLDLWSIFDFLMPNFLPPLSQFKTLYNDDTKIKELALKVTPFILRRTKKEVLKDLPPKYETVLSVELSSNERKYYDAFVMQAKNVLANGGKSFDVLPYLVRLRQICISPYLLDNNFKNNSSKIKELTTITTKYIADGHKILIFSAFVEALNLIQVELSKNNINYYVITGKTSAKERIKLVNDFNGNRKIKVFLISLKAGGVGLNLTGADTVIHVDPWWNVAAENQASDRAHRIGQINNVEVIKLICENTIEQRIIELQNIKKDLIDKVINNDDSAIINLSKEDLNFILS